MVTQQARHGWHLGICCFFTESVQTLTVGLHTWGGDSVHSLQNKLCRCCWPRAGTAGLCGNFFPSFIIQTFQSVPSSCLCAAFKGSYNTHTHTLAHSHSCTYIHIHAHIHPCSCTYTHGHTYTHSPSTCSTDFQPNLTGVSVTQ